MNNKWNDNILNLKKLHYLYTYLWLHPPIFNQVLKSWRRIHIPDEIVDEKWFSMVMPHLYLLRFLTVLLLIWVRHHFLLQTILKWIWSKMIPELFVTSLGGIKVLDFITYIVCFKIMEFRIFECLWKAYNYLNKS